MRLAGRTALVTGAARGIGLAISERLLADGAHVVMLDRDAPSVEGAAKTLGADARAIVADVTRTADVDRAVQAAHDWHGRLDIVVNNAATPLREDLGHFTSEAYAKSMDVNLRGPVFLVQEALPHLRNSPSAAVINVISAGAFLHAPFLATYAATKAALMSFTRSMAAEFAPLGVRVNALAPGSVDTDMMRKNTPEAQEQMANSSLQRRAAHPDEMVGPALFLASDAASFVTGQVVIADGGLVPH